MKTANMEFMAWRSVQTGMGHWGTRPPSSLCPRDNRIGGGVLFLQLPSKASKPLCLHPAAGLLRPVPPRPPNSCIQYYKGPLPAEFTHCHTRANPPHCSPTFSFPALFYLPSPDSWRQSLLLQRRRIPSVRPPRRDK